MPFLNNLDLLLAFLSHAFPLDELSTLRLTFDTIAHCRHNHHQPKETRRCYLVLVQGYRKRNTNQNSCRHNDGKYDGSEILNGVEYEQLSDSRADGENEEVELYLGMASDECKRRPEHAIVKQCNEW